MKRFLLVGVATVAFVLGSWVVAARTESPQQMAARAEPPPPAAVVAPLDVGHLEPPVTLTATAQRERSVAVLRGGGGGEVVTAVALGVGDDVRAGTVLVRANGRPVFVLPGAFPFYRDIIGGDVGDDVAQLQQGLRAAGYGVGRDELGVFGPDTQTALSKLYRAADFDPPQGDEALVEQVAALDAQIAAGEGDARLLRRERDALAAQAGPRAAVAEFAVTGELPAVVETVPAVGVTLDASTPLATLGGGSVGLRATVPTSSAGVLAVGATGTFADSAGVEHTASVAVLAPGANEGETVITMSTGAAVDPGSSVVVRFPNPAVEDDEQLLAPVAAIVSRGGRSLLYLRSGAGFEEVEVRITGNRGGVAAIVPVDPAADLRPGAEVRVGDG